ncbi:MAG: DUF6048 family protein [Bacteroidota bacterium]
MLSTPSWGQPRSLAPRSLQLAIDIMSPIYYTYKKLGPRYELSGVLDLSAFGIALDYGWGRIQRAGLHTGSNQQTYYQQQHQGRYFRVGVNYNFIQNVCDSNAAFIGFRYARSYAQDLLIQRTWHTTAPAAMSEEPALKIRWLEAVAGVQVQVWRWIYAGVLARYKFRNRIDNAQAHLPFDVIGWGIYADRAWNFHYYLGVCIPIHESTPTVWKYKKGRSSRQYVSRYKPMRRARASK